MLASHTPNSRTTVFVSLRASAEVKPRKAQLSAVKSPAPTLTRSRLVVRSLHAPVDFQQGRLPALHQHGPVGAPRRRPSESRTVRVTRSNAARGAVCCAIGPYPRSSATSNVGRSAFAGAAVDIGIHLLGDRRVELGLFVVGEQLFPHLRRPVRGVDGAGGFPLLKVPPVPDQDPVDPRLPPPHRSPPP